MVHEQASPDPCWQFFAMIECYQDEQYPFQEVDSVEIARMDAAAGGLTYEDFLLFPDDGQRHELIGGKHFVTPSPSTMHQRFLRNLGFILHQFVSEKNLGEVFFAPLDVILSPHDVVEPDLIFISNERMERLTEKNVQGAPDLVVEVISESSRRLDKKTKKALYERFDVIEYWLADPELGIFEIYRRNEANKLVKAAEFEDTGKVTSPLLPGLAIDLETLL